MFLHLQHHQINTPQANGGKQKHNATGIHTTSIQTTGIQTAGTDTASSDHTATAIIVGSAP